MSATGHQLETIVSRLSLKLGGRLAHCEDNYGKTGARKGCIDIFRKGYKSTMIKGPPARGLRLATPPSPLKPPIFLILKSSDFSKKE